MKLKSESSGSKQGELKHISNSQKAIEEIISIEQKNNSINHTKILLPQKRFIRPQNRQNHTNHIPYFVYNSHSL